MAVKCFCVCVQAEEVGRGGQVRDADGAQERGEVLPGLGGGSHTLHSNGAV